MSNATSAQTATEKDFDFSRSPLFGEKGQYAVAGTEANGDVRIFAVGTDSSSAEETFSKEDFATLFQQDATNSRIYHSKNTGKRTRVMADATFAESVDGSNRTLQITKDGFLFKSDLDGGVSFYTADRFVEDFDRVLCDGSRVSLQSTWATQVIKSRAAGDQPHGLDLYEEGRLVAADRSSEAMKNLADWFGGTEVGQDVRRRFESLRADAAPVLGEMADAGREALQRGGQLVEAARVRFSRLIFGTKKNAGDPK